MFWGEKKFLLLPGSEPLTVQRVGYCICRDSENGIDVCDNASSFTCYVVACSLRAGGVDLVAREWRLVDIRH